MGVTFTDPDTNNDWAVDENFQYEIWTDSDKTLAVHYQAANNAQALVPSRVTVLLDPDGELLLGYYEGVSVGTHPAEVLEDCQAIWGP